jgi:hypothetical protein
MLIAVTKLEERPTGGYKFKGSLPFVIRSKSKGSEIPVEWDGKDDVITPELESIEFFTVSGFKGDLRDFECKLMRKEVITGNGTQLTFDLALSTMWFKVTSHSEKAFKIFDAGGEITGVSGTVAGIEAKLPEGFPSPGKKYESRDQLDKLAEKDQQPGDYYIKTESDEQAGRIAYRLYIRLPVKKDSKDPDEVTFKLNIKKADGKTEERTEKWTSSH